MYRIAQHGRLAILAGMAAFCATAPVRTQSAACLVATSNGAVQGVDGGASCTFLGIPYVAPPTGNLRWKRPQPAVAWAPVLLNATTAPPPCAQLNLTGLPIGSEDCLKLNIWTPNPMPMSPAPVIVWFHPGSFVAVSANFPPHNGKNLAATTGAIVVEPNYRLGPFGYLVHTAFASEDRTAGNHGLLDQRAALEWVRDNIAAFGGNPGSVTIAGESAGAHSVSLHLVSPPSSGLFHRAIMESGSASFQWRSAVEAESQGVEFASALGCFETDSALQLSCLRSKTTSQVLLARPPAPFEQINETGRTQWTPVVDGEEIPDQPRRLYEQGAFERVPVIVGTNRDDGWTFVNRSFPGDVTPEQFEAVVAREFGGDAAAVFAAYPLSDFASPKDALSRVAGDVEYVCAARRVARLIEATRSPVFLYSFEYEVDPVLPKRVGHGLEINFVFGNNFGPPFFPSYALNSDDLRLSHAMMGYWTRFASTGNPNTDDPLVVHWPAFHHPTGRGNGSDRYIMFDAAIVGASRLGGDRCEFWEPYFFRSITGAVPAATP